MGMVRVYDVVASSKALYLLLQPKAVDSYSNLLRFDLAQQSYMGVHLPFSGAHSGLSALCASRWFEY